MVTALVLDVSEYFEVSLGLLGLGARSSLDLDLHVGLGRSTDSLDQDVLLSHLQYDGMAILCAYFKI